MRLYRSRVRYNCSWTKNFFPVFWSRRQQFVATWARICSGSGFYWQTTNFFTAFIWRIRSLICLLRFFFDGPGLEVEPKFNDTVYFGRTRYFFSLIRQKKDWPGFFVFAKKKTQGFILADQVIEKPNQVFWNRVNHLWWRIRHFFPEWKRAMYLIFGGSGDWETWPGFLKPGQPSLLTDSAFFSRMKTCHVIDFLADAVSNIPRQVCHLTRWEEVSRSWGRNKTDTAH